jgi:ribosomal protein S27E
MGQAAQRAPVGNAVHYERRRPEDTVLYRLVQEHAGSFFAQVEAQSGASVPEFVKEEFDAFLERGILAHGFLRLRCAECAHEKLVAFSCKRRGFCPSCGARRMVESAAHLVDHVIPPVPVRQWVISLPIALRILFAAQAQLLTPLLQVIHRVIARFLIKQAGVKRSEAHTGAVTLIQRFGSAANLNIHLHCLVLDGVYRSGAGVPVFHEARAPSMQRLAALVPRPRLHLIRFHGVLAPHAKLRSQIVPSPAEHATGQAADHAHAHGAPARMSWARLLKRVFDIDVEHCPNCGGRLKIIAAIEEPPLRV